MKSHYRPSLLHQARPKLVSLVPFALLTNTNTAPTKDFIVEGNKRSEEINKEQEASNSWTLIWIHGRLLGSVPLRGPPPHLHPPATPPVSHRERIYLLTQVSCFGVYCNLQFIKELIY